MPPVWDPDKEASGGNAEKARTGFQRLQIHRVLVASKKGQFKTMSGDRRIGVIWKNEHGEELLQMYGIEGKSRVFLSRLFNALGYHTKDLVKDGFQPDHLLIQSVADQWLKGKWIWGNVIESGDNLNLEIPVPQPTNEEAMKRLNAEDDIPF